MQVIEAGEIDVKLCQELINFLKTGKFEVNALSAHRLSNTVKWVSALANSVASSYDESQKKPPVNSGKAGQPSGLKVKAIHQGKGD